MPQAVLVLLLGAAILGGLASGLHKFSMNEELDKLWIDPDGRSAREIDYVDDNTREGYSTSQEMMNAVASPRGDNIMTTDHLIEYTEVSSLVADITFKVGDHWYTTNDVCKTAGGGAYYPCLRPTVLDCFAEGNYDYPKGFGALQVATADPTDFSSYAKFGLICQYDKSICGYFVQFECQPNCDQAGYPTCQECATAGLNLQKISTATTPEEIAAYSQAMVAAISETASLSALDNSIRTITQHAGWTAASFFDYLLNLMKIQIICENNMQGCQTFVFGHCTPNCGQPGYPTCAECSSMQSDLLRAGQAQTEAQQVGNVTAMIKTLANNTVLSSLDSSLPVSGLEYLVYQIESGRLSETLQSISLVQLALDPYAGRPSYMNKTTSELLETVSEPCNMFTTQLPEIVKDLVVGGVSPSNWGGGTCSCNAGYAGPTCGLQLDALCSCAQDPTSSTCQAAAVAAYGKCQADQDETCGTLPEFLSQKLQDYVVAAVANNACTLGGGSCFTDESCSQTDDNGVTTTTGSCVVDTAVRPGIVFMDKVEALQTTYLAIEWKALSDQLASPYNSLIRRVVNRKALCGDAVTCPELEGSVSLTKKEAEDILEAWRKKFVDVVSGAKADQSKIQSYALASDSIDKVLDEYSNGSSTLVIIGYAVLILYAALTLASYSSDVKTCMAMSRMSVGILGVLFVALAVFGGLGLASYLGIEFNATSTQVLPFLLLGLGVDDMFVIVHTYPTYKTGVKAHEATGKAMMVAGPSVTLTSVTNTAVFFIGRLCKMPIVVDFATQAAIVIIVNYFVMLLAYPALLSLDYRRQQAGRADLVPCLHARDDSGKRVEQQGAGPNNWFQNHVTKPYIQFLRTLPAKLVVLILFGGLLGAAGYGLTKVELGLEQKDITSKGTQEYDFLDIRFQYFSVFPFDIYEENYDYSTPAAQLGLIQVSREMQELYNVAPGILTWQEAFLLWGVPSSPDYKGTCTSDDVCISKGNCCASKFDCRITVSGALMYYDPTYSAPTRTDNSRGLNNYYYCLEKWLNFSPLAGGVSPTFQLVDEYAVSPNKQLKFSDASNTRLNIAKIWINAYGINLNGNDQYVQFIEQTREISDKGLGGTVTFPYGIPFKYWEQYIGLESLIWTAIGWGLLACFASCFVLLAVMSSTNGEDDNLVKRLMSSLWGAMVIVSVIAMMVFEVYGFCGITDIKISAIPAVSLIMSVGVGVEFTAHITLAFVKAAGNRNDRMEHALDHMFAPTFDGAISTLLGVIMLAFSEFEFIQKYFFMLYLFIVLFGVLNGLILLPVILGLIGPPSLRNEEHSMKTASQKLEEGDLPAFSDSAKNKNIGGMEETSMRLPPPPQTSDSSGVCAV